MIGGGNSTDNFSLTQNNLKNTLGYYDNYDEEEAEQLIEFDVSAWMPPELEQQFTQLAF